MRKRVALLVAALMMALTMSFSGVAFADPDFGPGQSKKGPQDAGARCHPPGQTKDRAECK